MAEGVEFVGVQIQDFLSCFGFLWFCGNGLNLVDCHEPMLAETRLYVNAVETEAVRARISIRDQSVLASA